MQVVPVNDSVAILIDDSKFIFHPAVKPPPEIILDSNQVAPESYFVNRQSGFNWKICIYRFKWVCCIFMLFVVMGVIIFMIATQRPGSHKFPPPPH